MPHQLVAIQSLIDNTDYHVHGFASKTIPPSPPNSNRFTAHILPKRAKNVLLKVTLNLNPSLLVVAGWKVPLFVSTAKKVRTRLNIPIVAYSDTQWNGTLRQKLNCFISRWHLKKAFSHMWVAGIYQFEYARRLDFDKEKIIMNALSCDVDKFGRAAERKSEGHFPKNFLFVGRFVPEKGLPELLKAWTNIENKQSWTLTLVGSGVFDFTEYCNESIKVKDHMSHDSLIEEMKQSSCFILPSSFEPWALVIHEATAAGLPVIATNRCGATPHFLISNYNGFVIDFDPIEIEKALLKIIRARRDELQQMSRRSTQLAQSINPELGTRNLISLLKLNSDPIKY